MEYAKARALLDRLPRFEVKPGLTRIDRLLAHLGRPECSFPAIHVTGTNGKGSVVAMLSSVLRAAGYRVGRYTSPDLVDFLDRICVDGEWISQKAFTDITARLAPELATSADSPSQFEALTAIAFEHFRESAVDIAVVEVGLGGRYDATNVVTPILTILTNVSLDHTALLGKTEPEIAWEKAGVAKPGTPMLVGRLSPDVAAVVHRECGAAGALLHVADLHIERRGRTGRFAAYDVEGEDLPDRVGLPLLGTYQRDNLQIALSAILLLRERGWRVPQEAIVDGIAAVEWPGRWEVVREDPTVILDGAHNPAAAAIAAEAIAEWEPVRERRTLLLGILADKDVAGVVAALAPQFARIGVTASSSPRSLPTGKLATHVEKHVEQCIRYDSVEEGVRDLVRRADPRDTILVTGSLTVVAEARRALGGL
ncbi:MAG: bifunctional folylpolyglutamate synthase/dihydrofolate synthase [Candidatus Bipolaricaulota bacterium]|nr:bifunctional folylpolyglutamate synthase/dihydrofolate synthase [Candidatus Bipolaricaulota bacterium]